MCRVEISWAFFVALCLLPALAGGDPLPQPDLYTTGLCDADFVDLHYKPVFPFWVSG